MALRDVAVSGSDHSRAQAPSMMRAIGRLVNSRLPDVICSLNRFGIVVGVNSNVRQFLGYSECEIVGRKISFLIPQFDQALLSRRSDGNVSPPGMRGRPKPLIVRAMTKDGARQILRVFVKRVQNSRSCRFKIFVYRQRSDTRISGPGLLISDVQARNRRLKNMADCNFSDAREINQALTAAGNYAYAAASAIKGSREPSSQIAAKHLSAAMEQIESAGRINKTLLKSLDQMSRLLPDVRLNDVVLEACETAISDLACKHLTKSLNLSSELPRVIFNQNQIRRVLVILLTSTLKKFGPADACSLHISTRRKKASAVVVEISTHCSSIAERPPLLPERDLSASPGRALHNSLLNDCDAIISQHGGQLFVRADTGPGITYQFTLPGLGPELAPGLGLDLTHE